MKNHVKKIISIVITFVLLFSIVHTFAEETEGAANEAYANFTSAAAEKSNMNAVLSGSSAPRVVEREGRCGWALGADEATASICVDLDNSFANNVSDGSIFEIEVDYYDTDRGVFSLAYSAQDRPDRWAGMQMTEGFGAKGARNTTVKAWRTKTFYLYDAKFNGDLDGYDFKVSSNILNPNHDITPNTDTGFGTKYSRFYPGRYGRVSTVDDVVIGAVRVKKRTEKNPLAMKITTEKHGNIFFDDEAVEVHTEVTNRFGTPYNMDARYFITDEYGNETTVYSGKLEIGANESKTDSVVLKNVPYGCFTLTALYTAEGIRAQAVTELSHCREAKIANPRAGTNVHLEGSDSYKNDYEAIFELAKKAGYSSLRDSVRWFDNEKAKGVYTLRATTAKEIEMAKAYGMDLLPVHNSTNEPVYGEASKPLRTPEMLQTYQNYCIWFAEQFRGASVAVESHNEWNLHIPTGTGEEYTMMMKSLYEGTKKANPGMKVVGIDTGGLDLGLMKKYFEAGALEYMDAVSYHPYDWARSFEDGNQMRGAKAVRDLMAEYGHGDKEIWVTETGWHEGLNNRVTHEDKAYYLSRALLQNAALKTFDRIYFYEFVDGGMEPSYGESSYGTLNSVYCDVPYGAQKAYIAAANTNWLLGGAEFDRAIDGEPNLDAGKYVYRFNRSNTDGRGKQMIALWTNQDAAEYGLDLGVDKATMIDMFGNERTLYAVDGKFSFCLTDRPVYLIGDFKEFKACEPTIKMDRLSANATPEDAVSIEITAAAAGTMAITPVNPLEFPVAENAGFSGGKAVYTVKTPDAPFFNKYVFFEISDGEKLYYTGKLKVNNTDILTITERHEISDAKDVNRWKMTLDVTNNKNVDTINANIKINKPDILAKYRSSIDVSDLKPGETRSYVMFLPEIVSKEMRDFDIDVKIAGRDSYKLSHKMYFTSVPYAYTKPQIDGVVSPGEYSNDAWFDIKAGENKEHYQPLVDNVQHMGDDDLSGKATIKYDDENLYFFIEVTDDIFVNNNVGENIWNGDSIQIGIADEGAEASSAYCELTVALTREGPQMYRHLANNSNNPVGTVKNCEMQIVREGYKTYYELAIPWSEVLTNPENAGPGYQPRFAFLINDDDGVGRNAYMEYSQVLGAIGTHKNVAFFSDMYLAEK